MYVRNVMYGMSVCMYVINMYVYIIYTCRHMHTYKGIHVYAYAYNIHVHVYLYIYIYIYLFTYVHTYMSFHQYYMNSRAILGMDIEFYIAISVWPYSSPC